MEVVGRDRRTDGTPRFLAGSALRRSFRREPEQGIRQNGIVAPLFDVFLLSMCDSQRPPSLGEPADVLVGAMRQSRKLKT